MIADIEWDGIGFSEGWTTKKLDAYIADYTLTKLTEEEQNYLIIGLVKKDGWEKLFDKGKGMVLFYRLGAGL